MPVERTEIELGLPVKAEEFEILSMGHIPRVMEDHWFMYFDGDALCFHRSWTGICIYKVHVEHAKEGDGYVLSRVPCAMRASLVARRKCKTRTFTTF